MSSSLSQRLLAEALGTFFLVLAGCGAIVVESQTGALGHGGVAAAFGLVILVLVLATGHVSGAHLNPAVTVAFRSLGRISTPHAAAYILSQLAGAVLGALALSVLFAPAGGPTPTLGVTIPSASQGQALLLELLLTTMLMFVITSVATDPRAQAQLAAVAIGGTVALGALWGGPISGSSMNPARSFGPAIVSGIWQGHWLYWLGPIGGALCGAWLARLLRQRPDA